MTKPKFIISVHFTNEDLEGVPSDIVGTTGNSSEEPKDGEPTSSCCILM